MKITKRSVKYITLRMRHVINLFFIYILACLAAAFIREALAKQDRYHASRYRKVVKKGLLWDSVEYHER